MASHRALPLDQNEHVRALVRKIVDEDFDGKLTPASHAFGVSHAAVSDLLNGKRGAGAKLLEGVARYRRISIDEVLGRATVHYDPVEHREGDRVGDHPEFEAAAQELRERHQRRGVATDESALLEVQGMGLSSPKRHLTREFISLLYEAVLQSREDNADERELFGVGADPE